MDEVLEKNAELAKQIELMERDHEETMKELLHSNDVLTKRVNELEERNKELFERCKSLNKMRTTASKHESEMQTLQQAFTALKCEQDKKEKLGNDKLNSMRDQNTELIEEKNRLEARCNELFYTQYRISEVNAQCTKLTDEIYSLKETIIKLTRDNNGLREIKERIIVERDRFKDKYKCLESDLTQSHKQTRNVDALLSASKKDLEKSMKELDTSKKALETWKRALEKSKKDVESEKTRCSTIEQEFIRMKSEKFSDKLTDYCLCSLCCDVYDSALCVPRILNCGHTFCAICIQQLKNKNTDSCPTCKANCVFNSRAPVNYYVISVVDETLKNITKERSETCKKCFQVSSEDTLIRNINNAKEEDTGELFNLD